MSNRGRCKDLFVVAYNLTTDQPMIFSYLETPDSIISDAVRCSMSIPYVFVPHKNYIKKASDKAGEYQRVEASDELWVDGGITDNYPIRVFDKVLEVPYGETLGFYLASKVEKAEFEGKPVLKAEAIHRDIRNLLEYAKAVTETIISSQQMSAHRQSGDRDRTIYIDYLGISMMNFGMTLDEKNSLIASGWDCVCERLGMTEEMGKCEVLLPTQKEDDEDTSNDSFDIDDEGVVTSSTSYGDRCVIF
jgi:NTE family protein